MATMVTATDITKQFGSGSRRTTALDGLTLAAPAGGVVAILGPNGAGKSTFVRLLATIDRPDSGELTVAGVNVHRHPDRVRSLIGLAGQHAAVEAAMTGRENLEMVARLFGHRRRQAKRLAADTLAQLGLDDAADRLVRGWSGGMRRRLDLGATLVGSPRVLLLDEPTTGLDPASRLGLWEAVGDLVAGGTDVVLTTQYLEEADRLADHIVIIDRGRVVADGTPDELKRRVGRDVIDVRVRGAASLSRAATLLAAVSPGHEPTVEVDERRVYTVVDNATAALTATAGQLESAGIDIDDLALRRPTLDEVFVELTGRVAS